MDNITYPEEKEHEWRQRLLKKAELKKKHPTKIYLASPYTHKNQNVLDYRFTIMSFLLGYFIKQGYSPYSPIVPGHMATMYNELPTEYKFWSAIDKQFIRWSEEFWVVKLVGWEDSIGMARELTEARLLRKPIKSVYLYIGITEREFAMECTFYRVNRHFSDKLELDIVVREE